MITKYEKKKGVYIMAQRKTGLACTTCGQRNYTVTPTEKGRTERLEIKKFCRYCAKHTIHKETK